MKKEQLRKARCVVDRVLREHFGRHDLRLAKAEPEFDRDDEEILTVIVVYDDEVGPIDTAKRLKLIGKLRPALESEADTQAFPVSTFVTESDWSARQRENGDASV